MDELARSYGATFIVFISIQNNIQREQANQSIM